MKVWNIAKDGRTNGRRNLKPTFEIEWNFFVQGCLFQNLFKFVVCNRSGRIAVKQLKGSLVNGIRLAEQRFECLKFLKRNETTKEDLIIFTPFRQTMTTKAGRTRPSMCPECFPTSWPFLSSLSADCPCRFPKIRRWNLQDACTFRH